MVDFQFEVNRPSFSPTAQLRTGWFQNSVECLLALGEEQIKLGKREAARQTFQFVLKVDPKNEEAIWGLCEISEDWGEAQKMLRDILEVQPESVQESSRLQEAEARRAEFKELEEVVGTSLYRKLLAADREKRFAEAVCPTNPAPVKLLGKILVEVGYIDYQQLESTLNLQAMLLRYGTHQPIGKMLLDSGYLTEKQLHEVLQAQELEEGRAHYNWSSQDKWFATAAA